MKSIRRQLTLGLLLGFSLLLGSGGATFYLSSYWALMNEFDTALKGRAQAMSAAVQQETSKLEIGFSESGNSQSGQDVVNDVFQCWKISSDLVVAKSDALDETDLPQEFGTVDAPKYFNLDLPGGVKGRAIGLRFVPALESDEIDSDSASMGAAARRNSELGLVLAVDRTRLDQQFARLRLIVLSFGVVTLLATVLLVWWVLRRGLAPLNQLADQAALIDARSLALCISTEGMPTELKPICHRLNDLLSRLGQSFQDINEYASKVSHELRTPLAVLRLRLEQSSDRLAPDLAEDLQEELHHITYVVEQSLLIAQAERGRVSLQPCVFNLAVLLDDVVEEYSMLAGEEGRSVRLKSPPVCNVLADPRCLRQILHNLFNNSLGHGHGEIGVKLVKRDKTCVLTIMNQVRFEAPQPRQTLGLGLRVVDTLLSLQPGIGYRCRHGRYYATRLTLPSA